MEPHADILIALDGASLTIEQVLAGAYGQPGAPRVELSPAALTQVTRAADAVQRLLAQDEAQFVDLTASCRWVSRTMRHV